MTTPASRPVPQPDLAVWMTELHHGASDSPMRAVPFASAAGLVGRPATTTRGNPLDLTPERAAELDRALQAAALLGRKDWPLEDPRRWEFSYPVRR